MAKRYGLSDEAWGVFSDLFIETHGRGRPRLSERLMLGSVQKKCRKHRIEQASETMVA